MKDKTANDLNRQSVAAAELIKALQSDDETLNRDMIEGETDFFEAVEAALDEIGECEIQIAGLADYKKRLSDRETRVKARRDKLRGLIDQAFHMADIKSHKFASATVTQKPIATSVVVEDEAAIPSSYFAPQPPKLDKKALLDALRSGDVPGARLTNGGSTIAIRRA